MIIAEDLKQGDVFHYRDELHVVVTRPEAVDSLTVFFITLRLDDGVAREWVPHRSAVYELEGV